MVEVIEADREAAKKFIQRNLLARPTLSNQTEAVLRNAFATHRQQAAKAVTDRLRDLPDDVATKVAIAGYIDEHTVRIVATALADALEGERP